MTNRSPKGNRKTETVDPEVVRRKNCVLPREARSARRWTKRKQREAECDKKRNDRESAEAIVPEAPNREGPNVVTMRIAVSKA